MHTTGSAGAHAASGDGRSGTVRSAQHPEVSQFFAEFLTSHQVAQFMRMVSRSSATWRLIFCSFFFSQKTFNS